MYAFFFFLRNDRNIIFMHIFDFIKYVHVYIFNVFIISDEWGE
jgi:hypothetical protein